MGVDVDLERRREAGVYEEEDMVDCSTDDEGDDLEGADVVARDNDALRLAAF